MRAAAWVFGVVSSASFACGGGGGEQARSTMGEVGGGRDGGSETSNQPTSSATNTDSGASPSELQDIACSKLLIEECEEDSACNVLPGYPIDLENSCRQPLKPVACRASEILCGDLISTIRAPDGECVTFSSCTPINAGWSDTCDVQDWLDACPAE